MISRRKFLMMGVIAARQAVLADGGRDVSVICSEDLAIQQIELQDLRAIFLGSKTSISNRHVQPVLNLGGGVLDEFANVRLRKSAAALKTYYRSLVFTGKWSMPVALGSDSETVDYVSRTRGAIGFVRGGAALRPGVKMLRVQGQ